LARPEGRPSRSRVGGKSLPELEAEYRSMAGQASAFADELVRQLTTIFAAARVQLGFPIQCRIKSWASLNEKLGRLSASPRSVGDIQDLIGLRIVLLFRRDAETAVEVVRENLSIIKEYNTVERLAPDQFGYSSRHFVVELPPSWLSIPTFQGMNQFKAEIQIRTVAQHIWAETSQNLQYKREESVPLPIRRAVYRASALLEMVDLEIDRILSERDTYQQSIETSLNSAALTDVDVLRAGMDELLPPENKHEDEEYSQLLGELLDWNIDTLEKLKTLWERHRAMLLASDEEHARDRMADHYLDNDPESEPERWERGVFFNHEGLIRMALMEEFGEPFRRYLSKRLG
jgi:putative GTP pyrophosphokinase